MTMIRRELPRSRSASSRPEALSHRNPEGAPFDVGRSDRWVSAAQTKPESSRAMAVTMCCLDLPRAEAPVAPVQPLLRVPGVVDDRALCTDILGRDAVERVQKEPLMFQGTPPGFDHRVRDLQLREGQQTVEDARGDQGVDLGIDVLHARVRQHHWGAC